MVQVGPALMLVRIFMETSSLVFITSVANTLAIWIRATLYLSDVTPEACNSGSRRDQP